MWNFEKASFLWLAVSLGRKASLGNQFGEFASQVLVFSEDWRWLNIWLVESGAL